MEVATKFQESADYYDFGALLGQIHFGINGTPGSIWNSSESTHLTCSYQSCSDHFNRMQQDLKASPPAVSSVFWIAISLA